MNCLISKSLIGIMLLSGSHLVGAADTEGRFALKGMGVASCEQFVLAESARTEEYAGFLHWLDGYGSALNAVSTNTFDVASWRSSGLVAQIIKRNCEGRPGVKFGVIAQRVYRRLADRALTRASGFVPVGEGEERFLVYRATIEAVQRRLTDMGFGKVEVSGRYDGATRDAVSAFQQQAGLPVSALPDQVTLWKLFGDE